MPLDIIRRKLSQPLEVAQNSLEMDCAPDCNIEDQIGDVAYNFTEEVKNGRSLAWQTPQEAMEAMLNILLNPDYDLTDVPFKEGADAFNQWNRTVRDRKVAATTDDKNEGGTPLSVQPDSIETLFAHADFFMRNLSLTQLKQAMDSCTDDDLRATEWDLGIFREMALLLKKMIAVMSREVSKEFQLSPEEILPGIFALGRLLIWADLSLRHNGWAELIDRCLPQGLDRMRNEFDAKLEQQFSDASPAFAKALEGYVEKLTGNV